MPRVAVVFTGGTISMAVDPVAGGNVPTLDGAAILARTPGLDAIADVVPIDRGPHAGQPLHASPTLLDLAATCRGALADPTIDGVVVVQGTDTIEETAFAWDLAARRRRSRSSSPARCAALARAGLRRPGEPARCGRRGGAPRLARRGRRRGPGRDDRGRRRRHEDAHRRARHVPEPERRVAGPGRRTARSLVERARGPRRRRVRGRPRASAVHLDHGRRSGWTARSLDAAVARRRARASSWRRPGSGNTVAGAAGGGRAGDGGRDPGRAGDRAAPSGPRRHALRVPGRRGDLGPGGRDPGRDTERAEGAGRAGARPRGRAGRDGLAALLGRPGAR